MQDNMDGDLTSIDQVGEFGLIEHLTSGQDVTDPKVLKAVGDDAAVYAHSDTEVTLVSTDYLLEGVHFDLSYVPLAHLGYKAVAVNLSDIAAMNGKPYGVTVSIAMSNRFTVEAMEALYEGIYRACENYDVTLLGGDTSSSRTGLVISVTALGTAEKDKVVYRSGAKVNDLICLSGDVGSAYAGLQILEREKAVFLKSPDMQPDLAGYDYVVGRQLKPEPRFDVVRRLAEKGIVPSSMIDVSDGLASEVLHICRQSKVGALLFEEKLDIDHQVHIVSEELDIPALTMALNGGEDYELLFTVSLDHFDTVNAMEGIQIIGHIAEDEGAFIISRGGETLPLQAQGWNHFGGKS